MTELMGCTHSVVVLLLVMVQRLKIQQLLTMYLIAGTFQCEKLTGPFLPNMSQQKGYCYKFEIALMKVKESVSYSFSYMVAIEYP